MLIYTTVLFDLDGTLLDPLEDAAAAVNYMCRKFGLPERTPEQVSAGMGRGITNLVMSSLPEGCGISVGDAEGAYRRHYGEHYLDNSKAYGGVMKMLSELKKAGAKTAVISNKAHEYTEKI
ncbi:MAG: HAD hydrolase-like protein, partial [Clostridiales bacterium]|nr:HAD hydrolase-like protein [Clostridiales bacterium]